ncbi:Large terminase phage packaging protein [Cognatiyoonia sediminum]|uniref:Large terminase phage packaging protein n=1 Tax=Cognatiyoonia sediminum TaxID=1508389 RepID=A0A1M5MLE2_9RHOB|nr:Large terminase phage packaging protein [Cognatiyoonia sediminum]
MSEAQIKALPYLFEFWAMPHQLPPVGDWRTWVILGGRGAGKTRAGTEWVRSMVEGRTPLGEGKAKRVALVADTYDQARDMMVFGDSGIMAVSPPDRKPFWVATKRMLIWPNGAQAQLFTSQDPEGLRGPQFDAAWVDELAKWRNAQDTWDMLQFALRLGGDPKVCVTTTPKNVDVLKALLSRESTVSTHATTFANAANLAPGYLKEVRARYEGSRLGRQELDGVLLDDVEGALWKVDQLDALTTANLPEFSRIVVAVDPSVTSKKSADTCGIVVVGAVMEGEPHRWSAVVLADLSVGEATPTHWARAAVKGYHDFDADRLVAEVNQGGELVENVIWQVDPFVSYRAVHASRNKAVRAEPVAALYEQGRVRHVRGLGALEDQMCQMTARGYAGKGSPDRVDALVWALHDLMVEPLKTWVNPKIRGL